MHRCSYSLPIILTALAGCQTHPQVNAHIDTVNAEYRQLEDYVYCLEDENSQLQQQLDDLRAARVGEPGVQPGAGRGGLFRRRPESIPRGSGGGVTPDGIEAPQIDVPGSPAPSPPATGGRSQLQLPDLRPPAAIPALRDQIRPAASEQPLDTKPTDTKITHITLSPLFTGGADFDSQPGDDGLCVVIEPRNAGEEYVSEAGPISIVVLDPSREGDAARVARWDFDLSAARQKLAGSSATTGIKLELPWPLAPPAANRLHLFVRYETSDGRKLQTDREVFLTPPGQISNRWTPRTAQRQWPVSAVSHASAESVADSRSPTPDPRPPASAPPPTLSGDESSASQPRPNWSPHR